MNASLSALHQHLLFLSQPKIGQEPHTSWAAACRCSAQTQIRAWDGCSAYQLQQKERLAGRYRTNHKVRWVLYLESCGGSWWFEEQGLRRLIRMSVWRVLRLEVRGRFLGLKDEEEVLVAERQLVFVAHGSSLRVSDYLKQLFLCKMLPVMWSYTSPWCKLVGLSLPPPIKHCRCLLCFWTFIPILCLDSPVMHTAGEVSSVFLTVNLHVCRYMYGGH